MSKQPRFPFLDLKAGVAPLRDQLVEAAVRVIDSGRYIGGEEVKALEEDMCRVAGAPYAVAVSNGLDALRLSWRALIECGYRHPGDKVLVPANTYIATFLAISDAGLQPVGVDPNPETMIAGEREIRAAMADDIKAVAPVHLYGAPALTGDVDVPVVEDAAQAIGATSDRGPVGSLGDMAAFSFYPTKNIGALGDAGCVTTGNEMLYQAVRALANYGSDRRYHNIYKGFNCRMDPMQAALLRVKLNYLQQEVDARREKARLYREYIDSPLVETPRDIAGHVYHQFVVKLTPGVDRDLWREKLLEAGVETDIHYAVPPHKQPCYAQQGNASFPVTEDLADRIVSLPIGQNTSTEDIPVIAEIINKVKL